MKKLLKIGIPVLIAVMLMGIGGAVSLTSNSVWADGEDTVNGVNCPEDCPGYGPNGDCLGACDGECDGECDGIGQGNCYGRNGDGTAACTGNCPGYGRSGERSGDLAGTGFWGRRGGCGSGNCLEDVN